MSPPEDLLGSMTREGDRVRLHYIHQLAHPPEKVWRALTEAQHLRHWFPVDIVGDRVEGAALTMPFWPEVAEKYALEVTEHPGRIRVWDPPRTFEFLWDSDLVRFELQPTERGTRLTLTAWVGDQVPCDLVASGYHICLGLLSERLDGGTRGVVDAEQGPVEAAYKPLADALNAG